MTPPSPLYGGAAAAPAPLDPLKKIFKIFTNPPKNSSKTAGPRPL
jgi:hypothetical protein